MKRESIFNPLGVFGNRRCLISKGSKYIDVCTVVSAPSDYSGD
jgi:hypothetical protein